MNRYSEIEPALDFADKYGALYVTIETDTGKADISPSEALEDFNSLSVGESFTLISINWEA